MDLQIFVKEEQTLESLDGDVGQRGLVVAAALVRDVLQTASIHVLDHQRHDAVLLVADGDNSGGNSGGMVL